MKQRIWRDWHIYLPDVPCHDFFERIVQPGFIGPFLDYFFSILDNHWTDIGVYPDSHLIYNFEPVIFITARRLSLIDSTKKWLQYHFPKLEYQLYQARSKDKAELIESLGLDGIVEDRLRTANQVAERGLLCYLINRPWNVDRWTHSNVIRLNSLRELDAKKENYQGG